MLWRRSTTGVACRQSLAIPSAIKDLRRTRRSLIPELSPSRPLYELPDLGQVVVVVFGDEVEVVDQAHGLVKAWVLDGAGEGESAGGVAELGDAVKQLNAVGA